MVPMRGGKTVEAFHEPSSPPLQTFVAYATKACRRRFLASMRDFEIVGAFHEAGGARLRRVLIAVFSEIRARRSLTPPFMTTMRGGKTVEATHEPYPIIPSFFPRGGEGAWRAVEGNSD